MQVWGSEYRWTSPEVGTSSPAAPTTGDGKFSSLVLRSITNLIIVLFPAPAIKRQHICLLSMVACKPVWPTNDTRLGNRWSRAPNVPSEPWRDIEWIVSAKIAVYLP